MITISANQDSTIITLLNPSLTNPYYLFIFKNSPCGDIAKIYQATNVCGDFQEFLINLDIAGAIYDVDVYEQASSTNLDPANATFLDTIVIKVFNPAEYCWGKEILTDEINFPILDENFNIITS